MSTRKFFKTTYQVTVLAEEANPGTWHLCEDEPDLEALARMCVVGDCVGTMECVNQEVMDGKQAAKELRKAGSEPGFFMLDDEGHDTEEA